MVQRTAEKGAIVPAKTGTLVNRASIIITTFTYPNRVQNKQFCFSRLPL
jgi:hypothetical protein